MVRSADDVFAETMTPAMIEASDRRAAALLDDYATLQHLRKALDVTQEQIGRRMGKKQVPVAQLEKRSDFLLSTVKEYVEALGGELELMVTFKDKNPVRLSVLGENDAGRRREKPRPSGRVVG